MTKIPKQISVPAQAKPFLEAILALRPSWNDSDLAKAANLARAQADIERVTKEIQKEGDVTLNARGTKVVNPKHTLLETLTRRELALSRAVHVHAEATQGRARDSLGAKAVKQAAAKQAAKTFAPMAPPKLTAVN